MSTTTTDVVHTAVEQRLVPLAQIQVEEGANPRRRFEQQALTELADSIRTHGLLQPLVVRSDGNGGFLLTAGERRLRAAREAGLTTVPVAIIDGATLEQAVDENLHRVDLDPIEEATAFQRILQAGKLNKKQLAQRLSKKPQYVNERLRLLDLPVPVQQQIADGQLPARVAPALIRIGKVSEPVAVCLAAMVANDDADAADLEEQPGRLIGCLGDYEWPDPQPVALHLGYSRYPLDHLPIPAEGCGDIHERYAALGREVLFSFGDEDADAGRSYGCLLEFTRGSWGSSRYLTDPAFIADRVRLALDGHEARQREQIQAADAAAPDPLSGTTGADVVEVEKERRKRERQQQTQARQQATSANFELGRKLQLRYDTVKITAPLARLLALLILDRDAEKLAGRGLRYAREDWQITETVERRGNTVEKSRYPESWEAAEQLHAWIGRGRSAEQILGRLLQALIAAHTADQDAVANSHRVHWELPGSYGHGPSCEIPDLLDKLAKPVAPRRAADPADDEQAQAT